MHLILVKFLEGQSLIRKSEDWRQSLDWSPHTDKNIESIEMVERRAARWVSNQYSSYDSVTAMLSNLSWRSLEYRRYESRLAMAMFYRIQHGLVAVQMPSYFERP